MAGGAGGTTCTRCRCSQRLAPVRWSTIFIRPRSAAVPLLQAPGHPDALAHRVVEDEQAAGAHQAQHQWIIRLVAHLVGVCRGVGSSGGRGSSRMACEPRGARSGAHSLAGTRHGVMHSRGTHPGRPCQSCPPRPHPAAAAACPPPARRAPPAAACTAGVNGHGQPPQQQRQANPGLRPLAAGGHSRALPLQPALSKYRRATSATEASRSRPTTQPSGGSASAMLSAL